LEECEKDPAWKKFGNRMFKGMSICKKPGLYDGF
jgi:hypothetical protein